MTDDDRYINTMGIFGRAAQAAHPEMPEPVRAPALALALSLLPKIVSAGMDAQMAHHLAHHVQTSTNPTLAAAAASALHTHTTEHATSNPPPNSLHLPYRWYGKPGLEAGTFLRVMGAYNTRSPQSGLDILTHIFLYTTDGPSLETIAAIHALCLVEDPDFWPTQSDTIPALANLRLRRLFSLPNPAACAALDARLRGAIGTEAWLTAHEKNDRSIHSLAALYSIGGATLAVAALLSGPSTYPGDPTRHHNSRHAAIATINAWPPARDMPGYQPHENAGHLRRILRETTR